MPGEDRMLPGAGARRGPGQQAAQADHAGHRVRQGVAAELAGGGDRLRRRGGDAAPGRAVGRGRHPRAAQGHRVAVPRGDDADPALREEPADREPARHRHRLHPRVRRRALVGADPAQPERVPAQDAPPLHPRASWSRRCRSCCVPPTSRASGSTARPRPSSSGAATSSDAVQRRERGGAGRGRAGRARRALRRPPGRRRRRAGAGRVRPARAAGRTGPADADRHQPRPLLAGGRHRGPRRLARNASSRAARSPGPACAAAATGSTRACPSSAGSRPPSSPSSCSASPG